MGLKLALNRQRERKTHRYIDIDRQTNRQMHVYVCDTIKIIFSKSLRLLGINVNSVDCVQYLRVTYSFYFVCFF